MNETADKIVKTTISRIREGGYHTVSFRDIAKDLGIKSASVYYHFPSKEELGVAVTERYTEDFLAALGDPEQQEFPVRSYVKSFEEALQDRYTACLCGVLGAESGCLPSAIRESLLEFKRRNLEWLQRALAHQCSGWSKEKIEESALVIFSALEGVMIFAAMSEDAASLKSVAEWVERLVEG